ncbi:MAG: TIGR04282 family arsenosugar biosynthesis glycosyltransferase [Betaproteobacteria bacterium]|nr:TIGR04282 family arsenosugar biosynthesis glycosyltransferase [Betaproteobacteria bacterium]
MPGRAKTRLVPRLGAWRSAQLHARLTEGALRAALAARCGSVELHATQPRHAFFRYCASRHRVRVFGQRGRDLGERMERALAASLRRFRAVLIVGCDLPELGPGELRRAARLLRGACDVVLAPAEDGGYGLIGARRPSGFAFRGIEWGGKRVLEQTRCALSAARLRVRELAPVWDLDRVEDLERLAAVRMRRRSASPLGKG